MARRKITDIKNGMRKPEAGSLNRRVWDIADEVFATKERKLRAVIVAKSVEEGIGFSTASVAYCRWRKYVGLVKKGSKIGIKSASRI